MDLCLLRFACTRLLYDVGQVAVGFTERVIQMLYANHAVWFAFNMCCRVSVLWLYTDQELPVH
jgi:hypothetical protein